jgi:hypothetical protein
MRESGSNPKLMGRLLQQATSRNVYVIRGNLVKQKPYIQVYVRFGAYFGQTPDFKKNEPGF